MSTEDQAVVETSEVQPSADNAAEAVVEAISKIDDRLGKIEQAQEGLQKDFEQAKQPVYPHGAPFVRKGENPLSSRSYSLMRLAVACRKRQNQELGWADHAKVELDLSNRLRKAYQQTMGYASTHELVPLGSDLMPTEAREVEDPSTGKSQQLPGLPSDLVKECRDIMSGSLRNFDPEELLQPGFSQLRKDMSANVATTGGTFVGFAEQGELIEMLRGVEVMSRAGAAQIDLPPQGSIRFPRVTGGITISSFAEAATVTESTPATAHLLLQAKKYSGLVDVPEELMRFSTSVAVEAWLRSEFVRDLGLQTDADMINGAGGTGIQGIILYSGLRSVTATTTAANGDTLKAEDPSRLYADIADQNAPVDQGFFFACTNTLWGGVSTRRADAVSAADADGPFVFNVATQSLGGGRIQKTLNGEPVITSTQVPTNRTKGSGTTLTLLLGGVGREWIIARAGVIEFSMTNSDASKFQTGLSTMRGTMYIDAGPRHENSFGMIDTLLNS